MIHKRPLLSKVVGFLNGFFPCEVQVGITDGDKNKLYLGFFRPSMLGTNSKHCSG